MTQEKDKAASRGAGNDDSELTKEKLSRREFAKSSVVAGAAALAASKVLSGDARAADDEPPAANPSRGNVLSREAWRKGLTIPADYYTDPGHYKEDERYIAENFWLMADHVKRIPEPGDYFVFKFGLSQSVIVVRGEDGEIRAFNNVCRHRGSRLCMHDEDPRPRDDESLSVRQLGESGNAQYFRCPYHAWLYDLDGSLMDAYNMPEDFDLEGNGLVPAHMRVEGGHIFLNFSRAAEPPPFGRLSAGGDFAVFAERHGIADLKIGARKPYPIQGNWKLAIENFLECYHCGPAHKTLVTTHDFDYTLTASQKKRRQSQIAEWLGREVSGGGQLNPGFETGSVDGKPLAPLLPNNKERTFLTDRVDTFWSTGYWRAYDDYVVVARFTPRGPDATDAEIFWLVHPDAVEGKDYDPDDLMALWDITIREDAWLVENNHVGVKSDGYRAGHYAPSETWPINFIDWYMTDVVKA